MSPQRPQNDREGPNEAAPIRVHWIRPITTGSDPAATSGARDAETADWPHGRVISVSVRPAELASQMARLPANPHDYWLFWDPTLGSPPTQALDLPNYHPGELWHAGLSLGQGGRPRLMDFVHPTWMLQRDPPIDRPASSWRLSLRACLLPGALWRELGGVDPRFDDLDTAALELGHRAWRAGVLMRHQPDWTPTVPAEGEPQDPYQQLLFLRLTAGRFWTAWATVRSLTALGRGRVGRSLAGLRACLGDREPIPLPSRLAEPPLGRPAPDSTPTVGVLIPTLDRYPYLRVVLEQLQCQTMAVDQVVVIDQTEAERRRPETFDGLDGLPLTLLTQDRRGQSTARNAGLRRLRTDTVLFLDDDVEIEPDLVQRHVANLQRHRADVSCGVTEEAGAGPLPAGFRRRRLSDVFPTCNCMIRRPILDRSGLFDLAFDHGSRADADLGTRVYLAGGLMVLEPAISVFHHKAPSGGLRRHRARVVTYADSRRRLWARHLPSATEHYLARRYFTPRQVREALLLRVLGTLRGSGSPLRRGLKLIIGCAQLPHTLWRFCKGYGEGSDLLARYPQIPSPQVADRPLDRRNAQITTAPAQNSPNGSRP